jgi:hypothetical protein
VVGLGKSKLRREIKGKVQRKRKGTKGAEKEKIK